MPLPRKATTPRPARPDPHPDPVALNAVLNLECVPLSTYVMMLALQRENGRLLPLTTLALRAGHNYWAVRNQLRRTPYFEIHRAARHRLIQIGLTEEARQKLARIQQRLDGYVSAR